jgi:hypothetical protein
MPALAPAFSIGSDVGVAHDLAPFRHLGLEALAELFGIFEYMLGLTMKPVLTTRIV